MAKNEKWPLEKKTQQIHHVRICTECGGTGTSSVGFSSVGFKGDTSSMKTTIEFVDCYHCDGEGYIDWVQFLVNPNHIQLYHESK